MATRISGAPENVSGLSLISELLKKTPKREGVSNYIGLQRNLALADIDDPTKALNNILDKIGLLDSAEKNLYGGPYDVVDWNVTKDFINERIDKVFLGQLKEASVGGGSLGSAISTTPRIRISDRLSFLNSFYGEGSFPGLHSGPDAQFYRGAESVHIGYVKFNFSNTTGVVTVTEIKGPDGTTTLTSGDLLGTNTALVFDLVSYETTDGLSVNLGGIDLSLKLELGSPNTWSVYNFFDEGVDELGNPVFTPNNTADNIIAIKTAVGDSEFSTLKFKIVRPYSFLNLPKWFTESPNDSDELVSKSADDINPSTTDRILINQDGQIVPYVQKRYWFSKAYVETRWTDTERARLGVDNNGNRSTIAQDSNMRWQFPPSKLREQTYNWGVRWDGYLRLTPGTYAFEIQTNVLFKIDMAIGAGNTWQNVFSTIDNSAQESEQKYISGATFSTSNLDNRYKYFTGTNTATDWVAYVPITIRLYHGGADKADPETVVPTEPNLFIKTTTTASATNYYSREYEITLTGTDGAWTVSSPYSDRIINILQDANASVGYRLVANGLEIYPTPISIALSTNGTSISSTTTGLAVGTYTLNIYPIRNFNSDLLALWRGRIASPAETHKSYDDMLTGDFTPDLQKITFDGRPEWWKVSEGSSYDILSTPSANNTPIDGFIKNSFNSVLKSNAVGVGLYGNGAIPNVYSSKPNIILGESRYSGSDPRGSNYIGIRLTPNLLGEGGKVIVNALPVNNAIYNDSTLLGQNDLGGGTNHLTISADKVTPRVIRLYLWENLTLPSTLAYNKFFVRSDILVGAVTSSDDPTVYGLPAFSSAEWLSPITIVATRMADDIGLTTNVQNFSAPLTLTVEKFTVGAHDLLAFSTTQASIKVGGSEKTTFSGKYIQFYTQNDLAFQFSRVDTGEGLCVNDTLKMTYVSNVFQGFESEIPQPPSDRVIPFGFDDPAYSTGICYPPYSTNNPLLTNAAVATESALYSAAVGNYDVFWGDPTKSALGDKTLTLTEKIEFQAYNGSGVDTTVVQVAPTISIPTTSYTHKMKIEMPLTGSYDPDMLEYIGNGEKVKETYYAFVNLS